MTELEAWTNALDSLKTMITDIKEDLRQLRSKVDKIQESHDRDQQIIRETLAACQNRCNSERSHLWQTVDKHRELLSEEEGARRERVVKGQIDYVFWTKVAAVFTSVSVLGVIAWQLILAIFHKL